MNMLEIKGKYNTAKVFTHQVDSDTISQITSLCNQEAYIGQKIRIMPDCHAGVGCVVGTTMTINGSITPNLVGIDIGCIDKDSEVMTMTGWIKISEWSGEEILQYNKYTGEASFTKPINYIVKDCNEFFHFESKYGLDQLVSDEHKVLVWTGTPKRGYRIVDYMACELVDKHNSLTKGINGGIKTTFNYCGNGIALNSNEIRAYIMISADGTIRESGNIELHFKKQRKIDRAKEILNSINEDYKIYNNSDGTTSIIFNGKGKYGKSLDIFMSADNEQMRVAVSELFFWDGTIEPDRACYTTSIKKNADMVQFMLATVGIRAGIHRVEYSNKWNDTYVVYTTLNNIVRFPARHIGKVKSIDGKKYCFTVPDGYFIMRRNDKISITGNCGMLAVKLKEKRIDLPKFDSVIRSEICAGRDARRKNYVKSTEIDLDKLYCKSKNAPLRIDNAYASIGTLGGGNHFIELDRDSDNNIWLVIHTGSRHLGIEVCNWYQKQGYIQIRDEINGGSVGMKRFELANKLKAEGKQQFIDRELKRFDKEYKPKEPSISYEMAYCTGSLFDMYIHDMQIVQKYAAINRHEIAKIILKNAKLHAIDEFETVHNYIDTENMILRKGAVSAQAGERLIIPINMKDGSLLCVGKGNPDWNYSAPHGAGRLFSRSETKERFTVADYKKVMKESGIYTSCINQSTLDECPMAYKPLYSILNNIHDTVNTLELLRPIYNFKASSSED